MRSKKRDIIKINELPAKEWVRRTKSVWASPETLKSFTDVKEALEYGVLVSMPRSRDFLKRMHPATFPEEDVQKLVEFFTVKGDLVLDPFLGSGTTAVVCSRTGRRCIGIELYPEWVELAQRRLGFLNKDIHIYCGDSREVLKQLPSCEVDFVVTSPPYWGILKKVDHKAKRERQNRNLPTVYGNHPADLSNIEDYNVFLEVLTDIFREVKRVLKLDKYMCVVVSDFRHGGKYYMFHADLAKKLEEIGFVLHGLINLVQDNKKLYPYGYPTTFVPNICNQFILVVKNEF